ncbi:universal stress protein [Noviherbaspirillum autotrophicum]|uniref:Universal stress protein n=1 Tax=Noviherbaspirillum autotrophicum TaxID=709839 RepID=A0A0C1Y0G4_9BURK|nr:universal stress protein [Noviherbaspirillum autotrophicum]KIF80523.1 universal stress protein [Noviherbaspirillum autotrophicum]
MPYKTVLVHVDESRHASERIKIAAAIAMAENAHLIGTAMTGASRYLAQARMLAELDPNVKAQLDFLHARAMRGLDDFDATAQKLGLTSFEKRLVDDEAGGGICLQARYADLVVIGQNDPNELSPVVMPDFPEYVVLYSGRPVLLVPYSGHFEGIGKHVLVAWDASMPATRAVTSAIPLLRRAQTVQVVVFNPYARPQAHGSVPGSDIALYLARHDVKVEVLQRQAEHEIGVALQALVSELQADLLVMGGYGHARFREILLGGVTSTVLDSMRVPVLMAH